MNTLPPSSIFNRVHSLSPADARLQRTLTLFDSLPDDALVDIHVVSNLLSRSRASIWRDVLAGRLAAPLSNGPKSTRWRVGDVRAALKDTSSQKAQLEATSASPTHCRKERHHG